MIESLHNPDQVTSPDKFEEDVILEQSLRPSRFDEFVGQDDTVDNLKVYIQAANQRNEALDHVLLFGPPGLGKTTLAGILTNLSKQDVFFIDEIHRLSSVVEEYLYSAMEDFTIDIMLDKGPSARSVQLTLNPFTLIGATTRLGNLTSPMRDRFGVVLRLDFYEEKNLMEIIMRSANILEIEIHEDGAREIASRSRGTPRIANRILRRARDFAQIKSNGVINMDVAKDSLNRLGIDTNGLDDMDRRILTALVKKFNGGPVGLESLGVAISEDARTIEEVYEPYLIKEGFIQRTSRGRKALDKTFSYLDVEKPDKDGQVKIF